MGNARRLESRLLELERQIKELKVSQAIAGSLIEMHTYLQTLETGVMPENGAEYEIKVKFTPINKSDNNFAVLYWSEYHMRYYTGAFGDIIAEEIQTTHGEPIRISDELGQIDEVFHRNFDNHRGDYDKCICRAAIYSNCEGKLSIDSTFP